MRILVINNGFGIGGIEMSSCSFANYCAVNGHSVAIMALYNRVEHDIDINPLIKIYEPAFFNGESLLGKILYHIRLISFIRNNTEDFRPDVVVAHGEWTNGVVMAALYGKGIPVYLQDHMNPKAKLDFIHQRLNSRYYPKATGVVALTEYAKEVMKEKYGLKNIIAIPNPIRDLEVEKGKEENSILTVGRLSKEKGHRYLIEAFKMCEHIGWRLDIVGDGPEKAALEALANGDKNIVFHGFQTNINPYLAKAKIFVLPSLTENFPLALIEAMSVGKACISTNCLAGNEVIAVDGVNGLVVDKGDANALALAIAKLLKDEDLRSRLSTEASKIKDELSKEKVYSKYLDFISPKR